MSFRPSRLVFPLVLVAAIAGGAYWWHRRSEPAPIEFRTAAVTRGTLTQAVTATGDLQPVSTIEVSSQISGLIKEVLVDYNSRVKTGDVLARIDPASYETRLRQAEAELANTRANHQLVSLNAERIRSLREKNLVSQQELDQAEAQLAQAEAQLLIRNAAVETAKVDLARCTITAPIDGLVLDRPATVGKTVAASLNAPVLFVLVNDLSRLQIKAAIAEADVGNVREDQEVNFTVDAFPARTFRGTVRQIRNQPVVQSNVVTYATIIDVNNDDLILKPGMTANVSVTVQRKPDVLLVSNAALRARVDDALKLPPEPAPAAASGSPAAATPPAAPADPRAAFRALLVEVGYREGSGRPTPDQFQRARALAAQRGIPVPERGSGGGGGGGGGDGEGGGRRAPAVTLNTETTRTLFVPAETPEGPRARPVEVRLGITDGVNTEVIAGLSADAQVITGVLSDAPAAAATASAGANNPFAPQRRRF